MNPPVNGRTEEAAPGEDGVRDALRRVQERLFPGPSASSRFLEHTVERALAGDADSLKESILGETVFGRRSFDPRVDPIVRVTASRLRTKLEAYYEGPGREDPVRIEYPRGGYVPIFVCRAADAPVVAPEPPAPASAAPASVPPAAPFLGTKLRWAFLAAGAAVAAYAVSAVGWRSSPWAPRPEPPRFVLRVPAPAGDAYHTTPLAISRDGRHVLTVTLPATTEVSAREARRDTRLTSLTTGESQMIPALRGARFLFWSPDGSRAGGLIFNRLAHAPLDGGPATPLCEIEEMANGGASWGLAGDILFARDDGRLYRTHVAHGGCVAVTEPARAKGERRHTWPHFLPDGEHFLYTAMGEMAEGPGVYVASLREPKNAKKVLGTASAAAFASTGGTQGFLLYVHNGDLMEAPFDGQAYSVNGPSRVAEKGVGFDPFSGSADFAVSANGVLVSRAPLDSARQMLWVDRSGKPAGTMGGAGVFRYPDLRRPGDTAVFETVTTPLAESDLWSLSASGASRLTTDPGQEIGPVWSPGGKSIAFAKDLKLLVMDAAGGKAPKVLIESGVRYPTAWTAGLIAFTREHPRNGLDVCVVEVDTRREWCPGSSPALENRGALSPDGAWIAYQMIAKGESSIVVAPSRPDGASRVRQISAPKESGAFPRWASGGGEVFFVQRFNTMVSTPVKWGPEGPDFGPPKLLFRAPFFHSGFGYAVSEDGTRLLFSAPTGGSQPRPGPVKVVVNRYLEKP